MRVFFQRGKQGFHVVDQNVGGAHQLDVERGVEHIRRGHALMHETGFVIADNFRQVGQEGDDIMFGDGLDLVDAGDVEGDILGFPDSGGIFARDHAEVSLGIAGMGFDFIPDAEFGFGRPDGDHFRTGIAGDHVRAFM